MCVALVVEHGERDPRQVVHRTGHGGGDQLDVNPELPGQRRVDGGAGGYHKAAHQLGALEGRHPLGAQVHVDPAALVGQLLRIGAEGPGERRPAGRGGRGGRGGRKGGGRRQGGRGRGGG